MAMTMDSPLEDLDSWQPFSCSISRALEVVGTRAAMLTMREAFYGTRRFDQFVRRVKVTDAVMAARLRELVESGLLERVPYRDPGQRTRYEYVPTQMGTDFFPVLLGLMQWGDRYLQPTGAPVAVIDADGAAVSVEVRGGRGQSLEPDDLRLTVPARK
ncbi:MAG: transcriptional regulator [Microbacteriaceae bacterium]|nr:transcriptional regulator [Microbacteriaceae bacterium]